MNSPLDTALISLELAPVTYRTGDYNQTLGHAKCAFTNLKTNLDSVQDKSIMAHCVRALILKSAAYRGIAGLPTTLQDKQTYYQLAVEEAINARTTCITCIGDDSPLLGSIYFNLGAAHADNPDGNLNQAAIYYNLALKYFEMANNSLDRLRTQIRIGNLNFLHGLYAEAQEIVTSIRSQALPERTIMQLDYLEAKIKQKTGDDSWLSIARTGLASAQALGATVDEKRFQTLLATVAIPKDALLV